MHVRTLTSILLLSSRPISLFKTGIFFTAMMRPVSTSMALYTFPKLPDPMGSLDPNFHSIILPNFSYVNKKF